MKKSFRFIMFLFVLFSSALLLSGCFSKTKDDPAPVDTGGQTVAPSRNWTIMVYVDGDNNLEEAALGDLNEMEAVSNLTTNGINVVVLIDRAPGYFTTSPDWEGTRIYEVAYDSAGALNSTIVSHRWGSTLLGVSASAESEVNMGAQATLTNFITYSKEFFPASNYCLILWNHGGGWRNKNVTKNNLFNGLSVQTDLKNAISNDGSLPGKAVCWDETSSDDSLYMDEVQKAVNGQGLNVIGFDACLMGMIEVAYEIKDSADYMIASEESEPGDGWEYTQWLTAFRNIGSGRSATDLCNAVINAYETSYSLTSDTMLSALDLNEVGNVFTALNTFSQALYVDITTSTIQTNVKNTLINDTEYYWPGDGADYNIDLWHFAWQIEDDYDYCDTEASDLRDAIDLCVIDNWTHTGRTDSHGLAIHAGMVDSGYIYPYLDYSYGYPGTYPVDFVQNASNRWVPQFAGGSSISGPGLLYRIFYETF